MSPFLEALFIKGVCTRSCPGAQWVDRSTADYYRFESSFGAVQLRKRTTYPQTFAYMHADVLAFGYGNPAMGEHLLEHPLHEISEEMFYDEEFLCIVASCKGREVVIQRDAFSTLPLFIAEDSERWVISSKYGRAISLMNRDELRVDKQCVIEALLGFPTHQRTLVEQIRCVYDRARVHLSNGKVEVLCPPNGRVIEAVRDRSSDPLEFPQRLHRTLEACRQRYAPTNEVACLLSGGCDSAVVAGYYGNTGNVVEGISFGFPDQYGESQAKKLSDLVNTFGIRSLLYSLDVDKDCPYSTMLHTGAWQPFYHGQNFYLSPVSKTLEHCANVGVTTLFTGLGGDELFESIGPRGLINKAVNRQIAWRAELPSYFTSYFRECSQRLLPSLLADTPVSLLSYSMAIDGLHTVNEHFDCNVWPVSPLANPRLHRYCQGLPFQYRKNKNILRAYMKACHFPVSIYSPIVNEDFLPFLTTAVRRNLVPYMRWYFSSSVLAAAGLIDNGKLVEAFGAIESSTTRPQALIDALLLFSVEVNLRMLGLMAI